MANGASRREVVWGQLHWPQPLDRDQALAVLRSWAADARSPVLALEARGGTSGVTYLLGAPPPALASAQLRLRTAVSGVRVTEPTATRGPVTGAVRLRLST